MSGLSAEARAERETCAHLQAELVYPGWSRTRFGGEGSKWIERATYRCFRCGAKWTDEREVDDGGSGTIVLNPEASA